MHGHTAVVGEQAAAPPAPMRLVAEMRLSASVESVPLASWVDWKALTEGDEHPFQVVMAVPEGLSTRGWYYTRQALDQIAAEINTRGLPGFLGHQKQDDVDHQFPVPVTHWIGARVHDEGPGTKAVMLVRGLVDRSAADLRRWVKSGVIRQTSIFGQPQLVTAGGETRVVGYRALSMDWTPLNRAGMPTQVVAMGEMDAVGEQSGSPPPPTQEAPRVATLAELIAGLKTELAAKNTTWAAVVAGLGPTSEEQRTVGEIGTLHSDAEAYRALAKHFGPDGAKHEDVLKQAERVVAQAADGRKRLLADRVEKVLAEKVKNAAARPVFRRMLALDEDADEAKITAALDVLLADQELAPLAGEQAAGGAAQGTGSAPPAPHTDARGASSGAAGGAGTAGGSQTPTVPAGLVAASTPI